MKQAVVLGPGEIKFQEVPEPGKIANDEVLLRIKSIGVCGSDIHVYHGQHPAVIYPVVQGHEFSALVERVGEAVKKFKPGMKVTARPQLVCGHCPPCRRGQYNVCQHLKVQGFQAPGVAQEFFVCSEDRLVALPDAMSFVHGALIEPVSVAVHATNRTSSFVGRNVVVTGAGTIGNLVAQMAKIRGAKKVLITDISDNRLKVAHECGVDETINVNKDSFEERVKEFFGDEGFQIGFEAAGVQSSLTSLLQFIEKGSEMVIIGVYANNPEVNMYYLGEHELKLIGSLMYRHEDYLEAVQLVNSGEVLLDPLISKAFPFDSYKEAYSFIEKEKDKTMKIMINF